FTAHSPFSRLDRDGHADLRRDCRGRQLRPGHLLLHPLQTDLPLQETVRSTFKFAVCGRGRHLRMPPSTRSQSSTVRSSRADSRKERGQPCPRVVASLLNSRGQGCPRSCSRRFLNPPYRSRHLAISQWCSSPAEPIKIGPTIAASSHSARGT